MPTLFIHRTLETARTFSLVLTASGISHRVKPHGHRWAVDVPAAHRSAACDAVAKYLQENPKDWYAREPDPYPERITTCSALYAVTPLIVIHWGITSKDIMQAAVASYAADAGRIASGELYRCVTALMLHADWAHLLGNVVALLLFGTAVASTAGWGVGWFLILLCGAMGNYGTALWYAQNHVSVGASTAVFAAVGLCAALSFWQGLRCRSWSWRQWTPLAGGLALLGFMGSAAHSDLLAHAMGFAAGLVAGLFYGWQTRLVAWPFQLAAAIMTMGIVAACWSLGLGYQG